MAQTSNEAQNNMSSSNTRYEIQQNSKKQVISLYENRDGLDKNNQWTVKGKKYNQFVLVSVSFFNF